MPEPATTSGTQFITENKDVLEMKFSDDSNLWDQLRKILSDQQWVANDLASMSLLQEMNNVYPIFLVRQSDNKLVGSLFSIEMEHHSFGGMYYTSPEYRGDGIGMKIAKTFIKRHAQLLATKPYIYRSVPLMTKKYSKEYEGFNFYTVFEAAFESRDDVFRFFPLTTPGLQSGHIVPIADLTPRQFREFCEYDHFVTGSDRSRFLQDYYSISFVHGVVLLDNSGKIAGAAAISPTTYEPGIYKIGPVYAGNSSDACRLIHAVASVPKEPKVRFVFLCRQKSAGDWILEKCRKDGIPLHEAGDLGCTGVFGPIYKDRSKPENIFIGQASPCYFDI